MRVLLVHPEDSIDVGPWSRQAWDLIVDLGFAGKHAYERSNRRGKSRIVSVYEYGREIESYQWVNRVFEQGRRRLLDRNGLDWWDILAMEKYQALHTLYQFHQLQREIGQTPAELRATGPHPSAYLAEQVFRTRLVCFKPNQSGVLHKLKRAATSALRLRPEQIFEIALDKWDSGYRLRSYWGNTYRSGFDQSCVVLPSAYSSVTRSVLAYARQLPSRRFLLITTRKNANPVDAPKNVKVTSLAAYVQPIKDTYGESLELRQQWLSFSNEMREESSEFRAAEKAGVWDYFPAHLAQGLHLREAWRHALESEPVIGVLCGDDLNYHTRLPLILARRKGLNSVYCSHGALDGGLLFKTPYAGSYFVKGAMERDYLRRSASIPAEQIVVGAPGPNYAPAQKKTADAIVFFSQPYEVSDGRAEAIYGDLIPRLYAVACAVGRRLVVKLHPFESKRLRQRFVDSALPKSRPQSVEIVEGIHSDDLMSRAWCGVTVDSSVAVECALKGIPFFLCGWLDCTGIGYLQQFSKFGVGKVLNAPDEIDSLPKMIEAHRPDPQILDQLWHAADPEQLEEIMFGARQVHLRPCAS